MCQELDSGVTILGLDGDLKSVASATPEDRFEVTKEDWEFWLQNAIPQEFLGQPVFEPSGGPDDLLCARRTPGGRDQVWDVSDARGHLAGRVPLAAVPGGASGGLWGGSDMAASMAPGWMTASTASCTAWSGARLPNEIHEPSPDVPFCHIDGLSDMVLPYTVPFRQGDRPA